MHQVGGRPGRTSFQGQPGEAFREGEDQPDHVPASILRIHGFGRRIEPDQADRVHRGEHEVSGVDRAMEQIEPVERVESPSRADTDGRDLRCRQVAACCQ